MKFRVSSRRHSILRLPLLLLLLLLLLYREWYLLQLRELHGNGYNGNSAVIPR